MNTRHIPFLRLLLPWVAGILAGAWFNRPLPGLWMVLLAGFVLLVFLAGRRYDYRFRWVFGSLLFLWLLGAGFDHIIRYDERYQADHFSRVCPEGGLLRVSFVMRLRLATN